MGKLLVMPTTTITFHCTTCSEVVITLVYNNMEPKPQILFAFCSDSCENTYKTQHGIESWAGYSPPAVATKN